MRLKHILTTALVVVTMQAFTQQPVPEKINWPPGYHPDSSAFYVYNEIEINAAPATVWGLLVDAINWPSWYKGAKEVVLLNPADTVLTANSVFKWKTMGLKFQSAIGQFAPNRLLAWESKKQSIRGFHVWLIIPAPNGCKVITAESQNGWLTFFEKTFQPNKLKKLHDVWLAELKKKSENQQNQAK